jgi:hypothetical protein
MPFRVGLRSSGRCPSREQIAASGNCKYVRTVVTSNFAGIESPAMAEKPMWGSRPYLARGCTGRPCQLSGILGFSFQFGRTSTPRACCI